MLTNRKSFQTKFVDLDEIYTLRQRQHLVGWAVVWENQ